MEEPDNTDECDVIVVGGGPAGLTAATAAAKSGARTVVFERQNEIGYPIHTSGGSWVKDMREFDVPEHLYHPIDRLIFIGPTTDRTLSCSDVGCVIDIRGLYQYLAERAIAAGATIKLRHRVDQPILDSGRVIGVTYRDNTGRQRRLHAPVTVDASGYSRTVSNRSGLSPEFHRYGFGAEYDLYAPHYPQDTSYLIVGNELAPRGYAWLFARGNGRVRVGVGVIHPDTKADARGYLRRVMEMPQLGAALRGASSIEYHTGLFPSEPPAKQLSAPGLLIAGDSGMQGSTFVGEGIRFAMYAGRMAGEVAAAVKDSGSAAALSEYDRRWRQKFGRDLDISYFFNQRMATFSDERWDNALKLFGAFSDDQIVRLLQCDFSPALFMGMARKVPSLLAKGGRSLIKNALDRSKA
ncbi:MAG TPA: NAD(P)/FAD-dependent oxidoreductase [Mycobacteriales bacterium]|nr:NAD(P)/FAD-dependent oxidoreductase [Mycobacteriales bacterium]